MQREPVIVGAGFAGLMAACVFPRARILEAAPAPATTHRALLRFRSEAVAELTGVPFRRVRVRKGLWFEGAYRATDIRLANLYTQKTQGRILGERSVWNLDPADRWIAPEDLHERLTERFADRIAWDTRADYEALAAAGHPVINTAPLPVVLMALGINPELEFDRAPIRVQRWRLPPGTHTHQTVYFPAADTALYRASITDDLLICEFARSPAETDDWRAQVSAAFALADWGAALGEVEQRYGKIVDLAAPERRALLHRLTAEHGVFSVGRFATWRNVLLDDVAHDLRVVQRLVGASDYERRMLLFGQK